MENDKEKKMERKMHTRSIQWLWWGYMGALGTFVTVCLGCPVGETLN